MADGGGAILRGEVAKAARTHEEIVEFIAGGTTPERVLAFRPSAEAQERAAELMRRSHEGTLTDEERSELEDFLELEHILILAKARARAYTRTNRLGG